MYATAEHAYQAAKSVNPLVRHSFTLDADPAHAKRMGREIDLREDWESVKLGVMEVILRSKYERHSGLRDSLLQTGNRPLVERNHWGDTFWGICNGKGENHLGKLLERLRFEFRCEILNAEEDWEI